MREHVSVLSEKTHIGTLHLKNRFIRSATWEGLATMGCHSMAALAEKMAGLARGGVGLIITGNAT
jgi:2,4-dienoyl-CoA reductase-like NADH-dependent reductase (Old Yellow Enzyme family)